jgi:hypothetical protein
MADMPQTEERIIIGGENDVAVQSTPSRLPSEVMRKFEGKSREVSAMFESSLFSQYSAVLASQH